jgi:hypothetical protein
MKKLIAFAVVFALIAGVAAFADDGKVNEGITISGSAGARFEPFILGGPKYDGKGGFDQMNLLDKWDTKANPYDGTWWKKGNYESELFTGLYGYYVKVNVSGKTDYAGFGIGFNQGGVTGGDFWVQPLGNSMLKFAFGSDNMAITSDNLVEGLGINLKLPLKSAEYKDLGVDQTFVNAWRQLNLGVNYTIADIGKISVGYQGGWAEDIDLNDLKDFQFVYRFGRKPPTNIQTSNAAAPSASAGAWDNGWDSDRLDEDGMTAKTNPILFVQQLGYSDVKFTAGFDLLALKSIGLGINLGADFYLPTSAKFAYTNATPTLEYSISRENSGFVNLNLGGSFNSGDFGIDFGFSAKNLGKSKTITYDGDGLTGANIIITGANDDKNGLKDPASVPAVKGKTKTTERVDMNLSLNPTYKIDGTTIGVNLNAMFTTESRVEVTDRGTGNDDTDDLQRDSRAQYTFGAFVKFKPFGNATLQVGIDVKTPLLLTAPGANKLGALNLDNTQPIPQGNNDDGGKRFYISVPITFTVNF